MFRAVFDSNIYISAFCFPQASPPAQAFILAIEGKFKLWTSPAILLEIANKLQAKFEWELSRVEEAIKQIARLSQVVKPKKKINVVKADPADNRVLECAREANAHFIVTGDKHLLKLRKFQDTRIISPADFIHLFKE